jgi:hypothetical protein
MSSSGEKKPGAKRMMHPTSGRAGFDVAPKELEEDVATTPKVVHAEREKMRMAVRTSGRSGFRGAKPPVEVPPGGDTGDDQLSNANLSDDTPDASAASTAKQ